MDGIFAASRRINPLQSFAFTSVDARAENVLKSFIDANIASDTARKLLSAGFSESLPPAIDLPSDARSIDAELRQVLELTALIRKSYAPYLNGIRIQSDTEFENSMIAFRTCARRQNPQPDVCSSIYKLVDLAEHGTAGNGRQSSVDRDVIKSFNDFFEEYENSKTPTLIPRYNSGEISITALFEQLGSLWQKFDLFRTAITSLEKEQYPDKSPRNLQAKTALKTMITNFQNAFVAVQKQFVPLMLKGTLEVRLARVEESAKLLHLHKNELPSTLANDELRQLANELACLSYYPVGPAFDRRDRPLSTAQ